MSEIPPICHWQFHNPVVLRIDVALIVDILGFKHRNGKFVPKEVAIATLGKPHIEHILVGPSFEHVPTDYGSRIDMRMRGNSMGMTWKYPGTPIDIVTDRLEYLMRTASQILACGPTVARYLSELGLTRVIDIFTLIPRWRYLPMVDNYCLFHGMEWDRMKECAYNNVHRVKIWLEKTHLTHGQINESPNNHESNAPTTVSIESDYMNMTGSTTSEMSSTVNQLNSMPAEATAAPIVSDEDDIRARHQQVLDEMLQWTRPPTQPGSSPNEETVNNSIKNRQRSSNAKRACKVFLTALMASMLIKPGKTIIGYDCGTERTNITTLSLLDIGECKVPLSQIEEKQVVLQLLQKNEYMYIQVIQCKVSIKRTVYYCGMHSHVSVMDSGGEMYYVQPVTRAVCLDAHTLGIWMGSDNSITRDIKPNSTVVKSIDLTGDRKGGSCKGVHYSDQFGEWDSVTVTGYATLEIKDYSALADVENDKLILPTGVVCKLSDTKCRDIDEASIYWETLLPDHCHFDRYSVLYDGPAKRLNEKEGLYNQTIYTITSDEITFALVAKEEKYLCNTPIIATEHPKLFIMLDPLFNNVISKEPIISANMDMMTYVNSKFVYVEHHVRHQMKELYRDILINRCETEMKILRNSLMIATLSPDLFAYHLMKKQGYMAFIAGEVIHIIQCVPQEVSIRQIQECYQQIPVLKDNQSYFLTPRTHILTTTGLQMDCNNVLPNKYRIDGIWYDFTPIPVASQEPTIIQPQLKATWHYISPQTLASSGIYSTKDLKRLREHIMFPAEQPAIVNSIARTMGHHPLKGMSMYKLFDEDTLRKLTADTWERFLQSFMSFGTVSAGIIGAVFIFRLIKLIIDTIIHGYALHQVYGWSIHLLGAIWSSITHLLVSLAKEDKRSTPLTGEDATAPTVPSLDPTKVEIITGPNQAYYTFHRKSHDLTMV